MVAGLLVASIYVLLFPYPFGPLLAGKMLPIMVFVLGVFSGPLLSFVLVSKHKSRRERTIDGLLIFTLQLGILAYGVWVLVGARPVYLVFEVDRFRAVSAYEVDPKKLHEAPEALQKLSWGSPEIIGIRQPIDNAELVDSVNQSLNGVEPSMRPGWWQPLEMQQSAIQLHSQALPRLIAARPASEKLIIDEAERLLKSGAVKSMDDIVWHPLVGSRSREWVILFRKKSLVPLGYLPVDGFLGG